MVSSASGSGTVGPTKHCEDLVSMWECPIIGGGQTLGEGCRDLVSGWHDLALRRLQLLVRPQSRTPLQLRHHFIQSV